MLTNTSRTLSWTPSLYSLRTPLVHILQFENHWYKQYICVQLTAEKQVRALAVNVTGKQVLWFMMKYDEFELQWLLI